MVYRQESFRYGGFQNKKFTFTLCTKTCQFIMKNAPMQKGRFGGVIEKWSPQWKLMFLGHDTVWYEWRTKSKHCVTKSLIWEEETHDQRHPNHANGAAV
jgi:hypothetical protein